VNRRPAPEPVLRATLRAALEAVERGQDEVAVRLFREVLALDVGNPVALYSLGLLLDRRGNRAEAERLWRELQRTAPGTDLAAKAERELARRR